MFLPVAQPLDLQETFQSGQVFRWRPLGPWWHGVVGGSLVVLRQVEGGLEFQCSPAPEEEMAEQLRRYFRLDDDLLAIHRRLETDPRLAEAIARYRGLRLLRQEPWECLATFLCSSHASIPRITGIVEAMAGALGRPVEHKGLVRFTFPGPARVAEAGEEALRRLGLGFRARYVARVAELVAQGDFPLEGLARLSYQEARARLLALPGVGDKVADCVLLMAFGVLEAFPVDRWVRRALEEWYLGGRRLPPLRLQAWARERFGPLAGYAQLYLFHRRRLVGLQRR